MNIDQEALDILRQQVALEEEKNRLQRESLAELQRARVAEQMRLKTWSNIAESVASMPDTLNKFLLAILGLDESLKNIDDRLHRIDEILLINLTGRGNGNKARIEELKDELKTEHNQALLLQYKKNLNKLLETAAVYGSDVPLAISNQIDDTKTAIARLEEKLNA